MMDESAATSGQSVMNNAPQIEMTPLDYGCSFLIGKGRTDEVRFWIESRTRVIDEREGIGEDFYQTASSKSENTFHDRDLFQRDNYDFLPIFSAGYGLIFRRPACLSARYRETRPYEEMFGGYDLHLVEGERIRELPSNASIREETYRFAPLVSQTEIRNEETGLRALIECPVKTMNTRREEDRYQVDTGPLAFPDLSTRPERLVDCLSLAFVAFNAPHFADFVIEAPTAVDPGHPDLQVHHFSKIVSLPARNRLFAVE